MQTSIINTIEVSGVKLLNEWVKHSMSSKKLSKQSVMLKF